MSTGQLKSRDYERELTKLHVELVKLQRWVQKEGRRYEGRDGAGKGGVIKAITERVSPRVFRVVALPAPTEREKSQMYIQRYIPLFPAAGEVVIFDRSWYNRAGVIDDGRKTWKPSPMDLKSYSHWYDYSRARDEPPVSRTRSRTRSTSSTISPRCPPN